MRVPSAIRVLSALTFAALLAGCHGGDQASPAGMAGPTSTPNPPTLATGAGAIGTEQTAGPFQVTLSANPATLKPGDVHFVADVKRDGQAVANAKVLLSVSMPSMKMEGQPTSLKATGDHYEGTANVAMAGESQAEVTVTGGSDSGSATYRFTASQ